MPLAEIILTGTVGHVLTGLLAHLMFEDAETPKALRRLEKALKSNVEVGQTLQEAAACAARFVQLQKGYPERVRGFLVSPEVESILRQVFSIQLTKAGDVYTPDLRLEFQRLLALHLEDSKGVSEELSGQLFDHLMSACQRALNTAINNGSVSALAAKMTSDNRLILDEIASINANLSFLSKSALNLEDIKDFEKKFRKQIGNANKHITPPNLEGSKKVPIEKLFVPSNFTHTINKEKFQELPFSEFLTCVYRAVILGNPGGGKSTFARKLCHDLAVRYSDRLAAGRELTPIFVTLRDYGTEKRSHGVSILQFIERTSNSDYQLAAPSGAIEYLLLNGRALIVFDGLDELLDTSDRQRISSDVELFAELYPSVPIIVTSREVGYDQAPLDEERFGIFRLAPFSETQIGDYVQKWFATSSDLTPVEQKKKTASFLSESRIVPDLTSNPLMLALMCTIYRGEGTIPRNRPDVYGKCAEMLFEKWDKRRGIQVSLPIEAHVRPAMNHLASWIYGDEKLQRGVPQSGLIQETKNYLLKWCFDDPAEAEAAAAQFIDFCSGRAWVFTDTGTKSGGERLYQFTHRTFLEYFTAVNLVQTHRTPEELAKMLNPHIAKQEWDIVAQLAFQLKGRGFQGDSDLLITGLLSAATTADPRASWNLLDFAARCFGFMVPTPAVRRRVTDACLDACIRGARGISAEQSELSDRERERLVAALLSSAAENRATVADALSSYVGRVVQGKDEEESALVLEMISHLNLPLHTTDVRPGDEAASFWTAVSVEVTKACAQRIRELATKNIGLAIDGVWAQIIDIDELIGWYGIGAVFQRRQLRVFNAARVPMAAWAVRWVVAPQTTTDAFERGIPLLTKIGKGLLRVIPQDLPIALDDWASYVFDDPDLQPTRAEKKAEESNAIPSDALFGAFALVAIIAETDKGRKSLLARFQRIKSPVFMRIRALLYAWVAPQDSKFDEAEASRLGFSKAQRAVLNSWRAEKIPMFAKQASS
jgi:hypothetical protein